MGKVSGGGGVEMETCGVEEREIFAAAGVKGCDACARETGNVFSLERDLYVVS